MKRRLIALLSGILIVCCVGVACADLKRNKHTHRYIPQTVEATCTEKGATIYTCSCGKTYTEEIPATGHTYTSQTTAATCTTAGATVYTCDCGDTYTEEIPATGHDTQTHSAKAPTCKEVGWEEYETCKRDGCNYSTYVEIPATGHSYTSQTTAATCTTKGCTTYTCACGDTYTEEIPALNHDIEEYNAQAPTCTAKGWEAYEECVRPGCNYTTYVEIPATGHSYTSQTTAATCTEKGTTVYSCHCGHSYSVEIPATGHSYTASQTTQPTCTVNGSTLYTCHCGDSYSEVLPATGHRYTDEITAPTCTERGYTTHACACGYSYVDTFVDALGHDEQTHGAKAPTCEEIGWSAYVTCKRTGCDYSTRVEIPATGHSYTAVVTHPTCTEDGYTTHTCACGDHYTDTPVDALGHDEQMREAKAPTCEEVGWNEYEACSRCDYNTRETIPALGHDEQPHEAQAPTCEEVGWNEYEACSRCDYNTRETIPALGHTYEETARTEPTCEETGSITYTCIRCDDTYTEQIPVDEEGHSYTSQTTIEATCTGKGQLTHTCSHCGIWYTEETPALGHNYEEVRVESTCYSKGSITRTCTRCGDVQQQEIATKNHSYIFVAAKNPSCGQVGWWEHYACTNEGCNHKQGYYEKAALSHEYTSQTTEATCTTDGATVYTCSRCGDTYTDVIPALGHSYTSQTVEATCTTKKVITYTCSVCGDTYTEESDALGHDIQTHEAQASTCEEIGWNAYETCSRCNYSTYVEIPATGHSHTSQTTAATCTEKGSTTYTCHCGDTYTNVIPALGHSYTSQTVAATCTEDGHTTYTCSRCDDSYTEEIPALGHDTQRHSAQTPTCEEIGWNAYDTCSRCDYTTYDEIPATGHLLAYYDAQAPTCTEVGWNAYEKCTREGCNHSTYKEIAKKNHRYIYVAAKEPSCGQVGWWEHYACTNEGCNHKQGYYEKAALSHEYTSQTTEATCTIKESTTYTCSLCGHTYTEEGDALGHSYTSQTTAATCTTKKVITYTCSRCGDTYTEEKGDVLGHLLAYYDAQAPTCTEIGWNAYEECTRAGCGYTTYQEISALNHDLVYHSEKEATCEEVGWNAYETCSRCNHSTYEEIPALGHLILKHSGKAATCTEKGWAPYETCRRAGCNHTTYQEIAEKRHNLKEQAAKDPTCDEVGWYAYEYCSNEGCDYKVGYEEIPATGHSYTSYSTTENRCTICGDITSASQNQVTNPTEHYYEGGLHKISVQQNKNRTFIDANAKQTDYVIVIPAGSEKALEGAAFVRTHVNNATGVMLNILVDDGTMSYNSSAKQIIIGDMNLFQKSGLTMPTDDLGYTGFYVKTHNDNVFIVSAHEDGIQHGVIAFLRVTLGYDQFGGGFVTYVTNGSTMPDMSIIERPDFEYYANGSKMTDPQIYGMGFAENQFLVYNGVMWHNSLDYLPPSQYPSDWFNSAKTELCYTAHGNDDQVMEMAAEIANIMFAELKEQPNVKYCTITIEDAADVPCTCDACEDLCGNGWLLSRPTYRNCYSALIIRFTNFVNRALQDLLEEDAIANGTAKREVKVLFFAYHETQKPPTPDGTDFTVCDEEVGVFFAPIEAKYNQDFYHSSNSTAKSHLEGWMKCTNNIFMWTYTTNFNYYMYPFNSFDSMIETFRFSKLCGADYYLNQGQHDQTTSTGFNVLKDYIASKALYNVNVNYETLIDYFFDQYYQVAKEPMRQLFDEIVAHYRYIEKTKGVNGWIYFEINKPSYWPYQLLTKWIGLIEEALSLIEPLKETQPVLYTELSKHIRAERIFMDYVLLELYPDRFSSEELLARRKQFKKDCEELDFVKYSAGGTLKKLFESWGL